MENPASAGQTIDAISGRRGQAAGFPSAGVSSLCVLVTAVELPAIRCTGTGDTIAAAGD
jgi:hypothetical protein